MEKIHVKIPLKQTSKPAPPPPPAPKGPGTQACSRGTVPGPPPPPGPKVSAGPPAPPLSVGRGKTSLGLASSRNRGASSTTKKAS